MTAFGRLLHVPPAVLAVNVPYALALAAVALEVAWLARWPGPRRARVLADARVGATMAAGAFVVGVIYTSLLRAEWNVVSGFAPASLGRMWHEAPALAGVVAFVAWDFAGWVYHVVGHRTRVGWAAHQPHHSGSDYDLTLGLRQSWMPFHGLLYQPLVALLGVDFATIAVCAAVSNCWQVLEHTSMPIAFPRWLSSIVMSPAAHRQHHAPDGGAANLGPVLTCWDRMAGTWVGLSAPSPGSCGPAERAPGSAIAIELAGWRALARGLRRGPGRRPRGALVFLSGSDQLSVLRYPRSRR